MKARAPNHVGDVEHASVGEERLAVANARDARRALDARRGEIGRFDANQRRRPSK